MDEYLEKLFADAYKREVEQEENVVRSLPFIAAIASVTLLVLREFGAGLPLIDGSGLANFLHGLLVAVGLVFLYVFVFLFIALRSRNYRYPIDEPQIRRIAEDLVDFYTNEGLAPAEADAAACRDLREQMIEQFAAAATNNRRQNELRHAARSNAFNGLILALALSLMFVGIIYIMDVVSTATVPDLGAPQAEGVNGSPDRPTDH
jgi:energy-coupling factor transporter transmembrane protein EcfT